MRQLLLRRALMLCGFLLASLMSTAYAVDPPVAVITCLSTPCGGLEGSTLDFSAAGSTGTNLSYKWDFETDGAWDSFSMTPSYTFISPRTYTVTLRVIDTYGSQAEATRQVVITNATPVPKAYVVDASGNKRYDNAYLRKGDNYVFHAEESTDASGGINRYEWNWTYNSPSFIADNGSTQPTINKTFDTVGAYLIALRVRDDDTASCDGGSTGCAVVAMHVQVIGSGAIPSFIPPTPGFLRGANVQFLDSSQPVSPTEPILKWEWDFDYTPAAGFVADLTETSSTGPNRNPHWTFSKARDYHVALRVTDGRGSEVAYATVTPTDVPPIVALAVIKKDAGGHPVTQVPVEYNPSDNSPIYEVDEDEKLDFDASASSYPPDPAVLTFRWDDQYDLYNFTSFNANGSLGTGPYVVGWPSDTKHNDCAHRTDFENRPYGVAVRALNDNSLYAQAYARIRIKDVPPNPTLYGPATLQEGDLGSFEIRDWVRNRDAIKSVKWIWNYGGDPSAFDNPALVDLSGGAALAKTTHAYNDTGLITIAAEMTDTDDFKAVATFDVTILDKPALATIAMKNDVGSWVSFTDGEIQTITEGKTVTFSGQYSILAPADSFKQFLWDTNYDGVTFNDVAATAAACKSLAGTCTFSPWLPCKQDSECPKGKGEQNATFGDGPSAVPRCIALCVLDSDYQDGLDKNCSPGHKNFAQVCFNIENVAPTFVPNQRTETIEVNDGYVLQEQIQAIDPGGANDLVRYSILAPLPGTTAPKFANIAADTGSFTWAVDTNEIVCARDSVDYYVVRIQAKDKENATGTMELRLRANKANEPPFPLNEKDGDYLWKAGTYNKETPLALLDADIRCGDSIEYYMVESPQAGMTYNPQTGELIWDKPASSLIGTSVTLHLCGRDIVARNDPSRTDHTYCHTQTIQVLDPQYVATCSFDTLPDQVPGRICVQAKLDYAGADAVSYLWSFGQTAEGTSFLENTRTVHPAAPKICFMASAVGLYEVSLHCDSTAHQGPTATARVNVANLAPTPYVPLSRSYPIGQKITLDATLSADGNNLDGISNYIWADDKSRLSNTLAAKPTFNGLNVGLYEFGLTVVDNNLASSPLLPVTIEVLDLEDTKKALPFASFVAAPCDNTGCKESNPARIGGGQIMLDASLSRQRGESLLDPNYVWRYVSGPAAGESELQAGFYENRKYQYLFTPPKIGVYTFELIVRDGTNASRPYTLSIPVATPTRILPVANAGSLQRVVLQSEGGGAAYAKVALVGRDSFAQTGETVTYTWTQVGGPKVTLFDDLDPTQTPNAKLQNPSFYAFKPGLYAFSLTLTSLPAGASVEETLSSVPNVTYVAVAALGDTNPLPVLKNLTGENAILTDPDKPVSLEVSQVLGGTAPYTYIFSQLDGPAAPIEDWDSKILAYTPDLRGQTQTFRLIVIDALGSWSLPMDTRVTVRSQNNAAPLCIVPDDKRNLSAHVGDTVILDGTGTSDPDSQALVYTWSYVSGPAQPSISDPKKLVTSFVPLTVGTYIFKLKANDGIEDCSTPAQVTVVVGADIPPVADAGPDQTVCVGREVQLEGSGHSEINHAIMSYLWAIKSGDAFVIDELKSKDIPRPVVTPSSVGTVVLTLVVSDGFEGGVSEPDEITLTIGPCDCLDKDNDGYWAKIDGSDCGDSAKPWDCNDTDKNKNAGIVGSCDCVDNDHDEYGVGPECRGPDSNDSDPSCHDSEGCAVTQCIDHDGDKYGDGPGCLGPDCDDNDASVHDNCVQPPSGSKGGCAQGQGALSWLAALLAFGGLLVLRRRLREK